MIFGSSFERDLIWIAKEAAGLSLYQPSRLVEEAKIEAGFIQESQRPRWGVILMRNLAALLLHFPNIPLRYTVYLGLFYKL